MARASGWVEYVLSCGVKFLHLPREPLGDVEMATFTLLRPTSAHCASNGGQEDGGLERSCHPLLARNLSPEMEGVFPKLGVHRRHQQPTGHSRRRPAATSVMG